MTISQTNRNHLQCFAYILYVFQVVGGDPGFLVDGRDPLLAGRVGAVSFDCAYLTS